jgi:hypothetical protein
MNRYVLKNVMSVPSAHPKFKGGRGKRGLEGFPNL